MLVINVYLVTCVIWFGLLLVYLLLYRKKNKDFIEKL